MYMYDIVVIDWLWSHDRSHERFQLLLLLGTTSIATAESLLQTTNKPNDEVGVALDVDSLMNNPQVLSSVLESCIDGPPAAKRLKTSTE